TTAIENDVYQHFESEVESRELGEIVMRYLRDLDAVAFVRFASVYRQFNDAYDFFEELKPMLSENPKAPRKSLSEPRCSGQLLRRPLKSHLVWGGSSVGRALRSQC